MRQMWTTFGSFLALLLVVLKFGTSNSAIIPQNGVQIELRGVSLNETRKENITMKVFEEAVDDYLVRKHQNVISKLLYYKLVSHCHFILRISPMPFTHLQLTKHNGKRGRKFIKN